MIVQPIYYNIHKFHEGLAVVNKRKYGVIDKEGNVVVPFNYSIIDDFHEGLAAFSEHNGNIGYMDKNGNIQFYNKYKAPYGNILKSFHDGLTITANNKKN